MKKIFIILSLFQILFSKEALLFSTELMPWTFVDLLIYPHFDYLYQHYSRVDSSRGSEKRNSYDHFYTAGVFGSYTPWTIEVETTAADTRHRNFGLDNFRITGKYQWMNDILGEDPISMAFGATYMRATNSALRDIGSFHHGRNEFEFHVSAGKERTCYDTWSSRWWTAGLLGVADQGSPWLKLVAAWEKNCRDTYFLKLFVVGLLGLGGKSIDLDESFRGYGPIRHRSVDIGARLLKVTECHAIWGLECAQRVCACNFPEAATLIKFSLIYPFSL